MFYNSNSSFSDLRIRRLTEEKNELCDQLRRVKLDLEEERTKSMYRDRPLSGSTPGIPNVPVGDLSDYQSEIFFLIKFTLHIILIPY